VELSLEHLSEERILSVTVHSCRGLRRIDRQGLSDPYVKVFLAPSPKKDEVFKTTVGHQTLAPEYHQMFMFEDFPSESLEKKSLTVVVIYRHDTSKDQPIGAINVPLYEVTPNKKTKIRKILNAPEKVRTRYIKVMPHTYNTHTHTRTRTLIHHMFYIPYCMMNTDCEGCRNRSK
jgi:Ca2+-dependent lipid-binding protein